MLPIQNTFYMFINPIFISHPRFVMSKLHVFLLRKENHKPSNGQRNAYYIAIFIESIEIRPVVLEKKNIKTSS